MHLSDNEEEQPQEFTLKEELSEQDAEIVSLHKRVIKCSELPQTVQSLYFK